MFSGSPEGSGKFTVQDVPSDGRDSKDTRVTRASPRRLDPGNGSSAWSPGGELSGIAIRKRGRRLLVYLSLREVSSKSPGEDLGKKKSILPAVRLSPFPSL